ncbi:MAG: lipoprotein LpqH [Mycobacterium sp.]|nr:lipoprotein LpqH [Mycobacterium sp.]
MKNRFIAAAVIASILAAGASGCAAKPDKVPQPTARVTINGRTHTTHAVSCSQVEWLLTVKISAAPARVQAVLKLDSGKPKPESVHFDNIDGFNGVANAGAGNAEAVFNGGTYTITGTAQGSNLEDPSKQTTADFRISASC